MVYKNESPFYQAISLVFIYLVQIQIPIDMNVLNLFKSKEKRQNCIEDENFFLGLYQTEYSRLTEQNQVYLDYTGGGLYAASQILKHQTYLLNHVLGNPHSSNPTSKLSTERVEEARQAVIEYFNADDYFCVFTPNASGALKIIGESYPFSKEAHFTLLMDNHNSVNGIREFADKKGASFEFVDVNDSDLTINEELLEKRLKAYPDKKIKLFGFPAQSNVSGVKHDLTWVKIAKDQGWDVLLDAAAFVPTSKLDLKEVQPCFVTMSFYKIFGYPTGLGCLLIRKDKFEKLLKPWFAGGTVSMVSNVVNRFYLMKNHERFEDGTINYLDIPAVKIGLDYIQTIGIERISKRIYNLRTYLCQSLRELKHHNGEDMITVYGPTTHDSIGGTVIFNVKDNLGKMIPFYHVEQAANQLNISIRSGCFCNPGLDEINHHVSACEIDSFYEHTENPNIESALTFFSNKRGAVRVSVGIPTRQVDLDKFIEFIRATYQK